MKAKEYLGPFIDKSCAICKLELREGQKALQCPTCLALFHTKHLMDWLKRETRCPICRTELAKRESQLQYKASSTTGYSRSQETAENKLVMILIIFFLGFLGIHRFLKSYFISGVIWLCTGGLLGFGVVIDLVFVITNRELIFPQ